MDPTAPVVLVHGWGGSFRQTWLEVGWAALLEDAGRQVIGVDLLGHGEAPKPHDPEAYADLTGRVVDALPDRPVDAVGFSMGAMTLLRLAAREPHRFQRLVVAGVGKNLFVREPNDKVVAAVEGHGDADDVQSGVFAHYANQPGNDPVALAAIMRRPVSVFTAEELAPITFPVLVVLGDKDFAGPADMLMDALPNAKLVTLRNTDHFATPESFSFIDAALDFLGALP